MSHNIISISYVNIGMIIFRYLESSSSKMQCTLDTEASCESVTYHAVANFLRSPQCFGGVVGNPNVLGDKNWLWFMLFHAVLMMFFEKKTYEHVLLMSCSEKEWTLEKQRPNEHATIPEMEGQLKPKAALLEPIDLQLPCDWPFWVMLCGFQQFKLVPHKGLPTAIEIQVERIGPILGAPLRYWISGRVEKNSVIQVLSNVNH